jgi:hypothetical protein
VAAGAEETVNDETGGKITSAWETCRERWFAESYDARLRDGTLNTVAYLRFKRLFTSMVCKRWGVTYADASLAMGRVRGKVKR